jgi:hypothetical protein
MRPVTAFLLSMVLAGWCLCSGGCQLDSAQRIALLESAVTQAQAAVNVATQNIAALQAQLDAAKQAGADSATLGTIQAALAEAMAQKPNVETFLKTAQDSLAKAKENPTVGTEVETYAGLIVSALGVGLAGYFKRKVTQANTHVDNVAKDNAEIAGEHERTMDTLTMLAEAVEELPDDQKAVFKANVAKKMAKASTYNAVIDAVKAQG